MRPEPQPPARYAYLFTCPTHKLKLILVIDLGPTSRIWSCPITDTRTMARGAVIDDSFLCPYTVEVSNGKAEVLPEEEVP